MQINRTGIILKPNAGRVLFRPFQEGGEQQRGLRILARVLALTEKEVFLTLEDVLREFGSRHQKLRDHFLISFERIRQLLPTDQPLSDERKLLIGAYFTHEYSLEAAALFNPSMVLHPDQTGLPEGAIRFVLSLRATGEGHVSSITFRSGAIDKDGAITIDTPSRFVMFPEQIPNTSYEKSLFQRKLQELGAAEAMAETVLLALPDNFTIEQLRQEIQFLRRHAHLRNSEFDRTANRMLHLAQSNYEVVYSPDQPLSERVIFPTPQTKPMGSRMRASSGLSRKTAPPFMSPLTRPTTGASFSAAFGNPRFSPLPDLHAQWTRSAEQGHGAFPAPHPRPLRHAFTPGRRKPLPDVFGRSPFLAHQSTLLKPTYHWEFLQIGNCGSPIETEAGWLVISHGVGPMRKYSIGAFLLDRTIPCASSDACAPPAQPRRTEREGYVPNVVYSCGSMVHAGLLILPYAMSDTASSFATVPVADLLAAMKSK